MKHFCLAKRVGVEGAIYASESKTSARADLIVIS